MVDLQGVRTSTNEISPSRPFKLPRPVNGFRQEKPEIPKKPVVNGFRKEKPAIPKKPLNGTCVNAVSEQATWAQRKLRMDTALSWLKSEMKLLRIHDRLIEAQFHQVQSTIDSIKKEREEMRRRKRSISLETEPDEEEEHWEDWEIKEFEQSYQEQYGMSLDSRMIAASKEVRNVERRPVQQQQQQHPKQQQQPKQQQHQFTKQQQQQHKQQHKPVQRAQTHKAYRVTIPRTETKISV